MRIVAVLLTWIVCTPATAATLLDARAATVPTTLVVQSPAHSNPHLPSRREMTSESVIEDEESDDFDPLITPSLPYLNAVLLLDRPMGASPASGQSFAARARRPAILRC